ncbi:MAG: glycosyltransferase, partial [Chitinivibrionales bacterium]|nr:glycosyltransferase [Chitinivibrionales bacterium]MBD3394899.1 glycosyltransferase [Chitinivibrionales bacterium]
MKISVVVPFHNAARHLASCLEALAAQRFQDAEFILVNNASRDGSRR